MDVNTDNKKRQERHSASLAMLFDSRQRNEVINRRKAYCSNCDSNVLHVRLFERRWLYKLDKITFSFLGWLGLGPWQCVDCSFRGMRLIPPQEGAPTITDRQPAAEEVQPVGNYLRTQQSLAHACSNESRFSQKYRMGIVERLLDCKSSVTKVCSELGISELVVQRWIREYLQIQIEKTSVHNESAMITMEHAGRDSSHQVNWDREEMAGSVIESTAIRKPR